MKFTSKSKFGYAFACFIAIAASSTVAAETILKGGRWVKLPWGASPTQVVKESKGAARLVKDGGPKTRIKGLQNLVDENSRFFGAPVEANYYFDPKSQRLALVTMIIEPQYCDPTEKKLKQMGAGAFKPMSRSKVLAYSKRTWSVSNYKIDYIMIDTTYNGFRQCQINLKPRY